jgi:F0F1-type ATP synthase assembly protein I
MSDPSLPSLNELQQHIDKAKKDIERHHDESSGRLPQERADFMRSVWGLVSGSMVGTLSGYAVDNWLNSSPIAIITGFFLGFGVGLYSLIRRTKSMS